MRALLTILVTVGLLLGSLWWSMSTKSANSSTPIVVETDTDEFVASESPPTELDDPDAVVDTASDEHSADDDSRIALATQAKPEIVAVVDSSKPTAPLEFVVVDERSGLNLPRFLVKLSDTAGRSIDVVTDDQGAMTTEPLALGVVTAVLLDHPARQGRPPTLSIDHIARATRPHVASVVSGPTYRVMFEPTVGPELRALRMRLTLGNEEGEQNSSLYEPLRADEPFRHEGEACWVRFHAFDTTLTQARRIEARSRDGLWSGGSRATVVLGESVEPVLIRLEACGIVRGRVTADGMPAPGVVVTFRPPTDAAKKGGYSASGRTDGNGDYRLEFVRPSEAKLTLSSIECEPMTRDVTLHSGETLVSDFDLTPLPTVGRIAGTLVSESGTYDPKVGVNLVRVGEERGDSPRMRLNLKWKSVDGRRVAEFDFGSLPRAKYRLDFDRVDWFEWTPRKIEVLAPKSDIEVRIADLAQIADFAFSIHDADNGLALNRAHLLLETIDGERKSWVNSNDVVLMGYPEDKRLRWRLDKTGYPSRIGDVKSFEVVTIVDGRRRRTCEINLQPGWSEVVRVTHGKDEKPLENAAVSLDGREAGKTNKSGQLRVSARERPQAVTVALEGWRVEKGADLRTPAQRNFRRFLDVRMRQAKKK